MTKIAGESLCLDLARNNFIELNDMRSLNLLWKYLEINQQITTLTSSDRNFCAFLRSKQQFDVVIVEVLMGDALLALGQYFNAPVIATSAIGATKWTADLVGMPRFPAHMPNAVDPYTDRMTFWQRTHTSLSYWFDALITEPYLLWSQQALMAQIFPVHASDWPSFSEIRRNVSLVLLNTHNTYGVPMAYTPNMIEVGGLHIKREPAPLKSNVRRFLDAAQSGAIYVSLGSNVLLSRLPNKAKTAILTAFTAYPSVRLLIKCDEFVTIPSHSAADVLIEPWFEQQSVLAHPNVRAFVTHGGLLSITGKLPFTQEMPTNSISFGTLPCFSPTLESVHFGKPVIGIPFFFDQHMNMALAEQIGFGLSIPYEYLTAEKLKLAVGKLLENTRFGPALHCV